MKTYITLITLLPIHQYATGLSYNPRNNNDMRRRSSSGRMNDDYDSMSRQEDYDRYLGGDYDNRDVLRDPYGPSQRSGDSRVDDRYLVRDSQII